MSFFDSAKKWAANASNALHALDIIGELAQSVMGTKSGTHALQAIETVVKIIDHVRSGLDGRMTQADVEAALDQLHADIAANNAKVDAEADAKFDSSNE